jgi:hypothetical protein
LGLSFELENPLENVPLSGNLSSENSDLVTENLDLGLDLVTEDLALVTEDLDLVTENGFRKTKKFEGFETFEKGSMFHIGELRSMTVEQKVEFFLEEAAAYETALEQQVALGEFTVKRNPLLSRCNG